MTRRLFTPGALTLFAALFLTITIPPASAQTPAPPLIDWKAGPTKAVIGSQLAEIQVPAGYKFAGPKDTQKLLESWENPIAGNELGMITPASDSEDWVLVFTWEETGYVEDEDRDELDADDLLSSLKDGVAEGNKLRAQRGWESLDLVGWKVKPHYDTATNNLTWATILSAKSSGQTINHNIRLLGRRGVMSAELLSSPEEYSTAVTNADTVLKGYSFVQGSRYVDYVSGTDKVAEYGLAALITGGAVAAAAKSGLLGKFWKFILLGIAAAAAGVKKLFGRSEG